jgi:hypothetical protein
MCPLAVLSKQELGIVNQRSNDGCPSRPQEACRSAPWREAVGYTRAGSIVLGSMIGLLLLQIEIADATESAAIQGRWKNLGTGVLKETQTRQEWLQQDNGGDIDWDGARIYCERRHQGWRLPRLSELKSIYDEREPGVRCAQSICRVSSQFRLTGTWYWSATQVGKDSSDGIELAWGVLMVNGAQTQTVREASYGSRALCVRDL